MLRGIQSGGETNITKGRQWKKREIRGKKEVSPQEEGRGAPGMTVLGVNWTLNRFKYTSKTTPCFLFRYAFMPLIDDSDDEIEEFMVTSENLSEWYVFLLNNHCICCNKETLCLYLWCKVSNSFFPVKYF